MAGRSDDEAAEVRTFLIADVRGYTRFTQTRGDEAAAALAGRFAAVVADVVEKRDGRLLELRGDEALVVFGSPRQAVRCGLELQARFVEETIADPKLPLGVGIGIDSGEAIPVRGGYRGAALNLAARLCATAAAGQVQASAEVTHLARRIDGVRYVDRGQMSFKGIDQPTRVVRIVPEGVDPAIDPDFLYAINPPDLAALARQKQDRRRRLVIGAVAAAVALADIGVVIDRVGGTTALAAIGSDAVGRVSLSGGVLHASSKVGNSPGPIAAGLGAVWVGNVSDDTVSRIDLASPSSPSNTIQVRSDPSGIAVGDNAVWVANAGDGSVSRINPLANKVVERIPVGTAPQAVAVGFGKVWVANALDDTVTVINPNHNRGQEVVATIAVGAQPAALAIGFGSVWVADSGSSQVSRISPRSNQVVAAVTVGNAPQSLATDPQGMYVTNTLDNTVSHINPQSNSVVNTLHVGQEPAGIAASGDAVWVANSNGDSVSRIDTAQDRVVKTIPVGNAPQGAVVAGHDLWVTARGSAQQHRGGTLRIIAESDDVLTLDPAVAYTMFSWSLLSIVNDGLVTLRRTAGAAGAQVVPDLAVGLPTVSDQGRTYSFQLRPGLRYSNGTQVKASDFRSSLERTLRFSVSGYYHDIVGADRCSRRGCDLSRGIVTDDVGGTIGIHLTRPDPDLLSTLALPFASLLPSSTAGRDLGFAPHPATGPYVITSRTSRRLRLERNPRFVPWSSVAQPTGYPDVIDVTIVNGADFNRSPGNVAAVIGDRYDWTPETVPTQSIDGLVRSKTTQVHQYASSGAHYFVLNTRIPPFNDVRVRQAVNLAIDRKAAVNQFGGSLLGRPSCQVLPATLFGYRPYCRYTQHPNAAGTWTAPDIVKARDLIRQANALGAPVTVVSRPDQPALSALLVQTMNKIGLHAVVRPFPDLGARTTEAYFEYIGKRRNHVMAAFAGWGSDYPEPSSFFSPLLRCDAITTNLPVNSNAGFFCDHTVDAAMDRAAALQTSDPAAAAAAWAGVDRQVADLAPWVFLSADRRYDAVSTRLGNYQNHPEYGMLLDQAWVR
jgi:peptide/nickel transport system substrate-binding protein